MPSHCAHRCHKSVLPLWAIALVAVAAVFPTAAVGAPVPQPRSSDLQPVAQRHTEINIVLGKSETRQLPPGIERISVADPRVADIRLISTTQPPQLYLLGKRLGSTNVMLWTRAGDVRVLDVTVGHDLNRVQSSINELLPGEQIKVSSSSESLILTGVVSSAEKAHMAVQIANSYIRGINRGLVANVTDRESSPAPKADGNQAASPVGAVATAGRAGGRETIKDILDVAGAQVVNMLRISSPQQVMLEVKVAEVSKTLLDSLGASFGASRTEGSWTYSIITNLLTNSGGLFSAIKNTRNFAQIDAEKKDGLVKILAEPNIVAVSGQEGSFLAGGKIFIPVARANSMGGTTITLEEKEFGVGLKFTPTVLDGGRINLKVAPEVSELSQTGSPFVTIDGATAILPSFTVRRAQTTVQLNDGQSFAIAGLIKNNVTETIKRLPMLGEVPILGALFRSNEFQTDQTELMFVITPRLVKPLPPNYALPTDHFQPPSRAEFFLGGAMEGSPREPKTEANPEAKPATPAKGGFDVR